MGQPGHQRAALSGKNRDPLLRPRAQLPRAAVPVRDPGGLAQRRRRAPRRPGAGDDAELPAAGDRPLRNHARQRGGGADQPDEQSLRAGPLHPQRR